jgi:hypothetical protein
MHLSVGKIEERILPLGIFFTPANAVKPTF